MFEIGDYVVYGTSGICKVSDITKLNLPKCNNEKKYYLLLPIREKGSKIYSAIDSENTNTRKVMNAEQAWDLIKEIPVIDEIRIDNDKQREEKFKEAVKSCDCRELVKVIKTLYQRRLKRQNEGKKNTAVDDKYFKLAEDNLYGELAFAIGKDRNEMQELIASTINKQKG